MTLAKIASVCGTFLSGLLLTTWRKRKPRRCKITAIVEGAGRMASSRPCCRSPAMAVLAVKRIEDTVVRNVGSCCAWAKARSTRASAASGYRSSQRRRPLKAACKLRQTIPVRFSASPTAMLWRPQPKMSSARRALPSQYFSAISAWKARRVAPVMREAARRKSAICGGVRDMGTGGVEPNISMEDPHVENGWQNKRKPQSNPSTPRCLGKIFSRDGLRLLLHRVEIATYGIGQMKVDTFGKRNLHTFFTPTSV